MLLHKSVEFDSRVRREARALAEAGHTVTVAHLPRTLGPSPDDGYAVVPALPPRALRRLPLRAHRLRMFGGFIRAASRTRPDAVHAHDAAMLAPALVAARATGARLVYDSHELATGVPYRERLWARFVRVLERTVIRRCEAVITVSDGIADRLVSLHGLRTRPTVVRNLPELAGQRGRGGLRARLEIGDAPLVLHQGACARSRGCEQLIRAIPDVPDAHLAFLGDEGDPGYTERLRRLAADEGVAERVHFLPSVPVDELLAHTREADVGVSLLQDDCENHRLALPNKVFDYVAAEVPVVVSRLPELERLVAGYGVGWTTDPAQPKEIAAAINVALARRGDPEVQARLRDAAVQLRWEIEKERLVALYDGL